MRRVGQTIVLVLLLSLFVPDEVNAHPGTGIVVDWQGRVYFTDLKQIWRIERDGRLTVAVAHKHSHALRLDESGSLLGEHLVYEASRDRWQTSVWQLAPDGKLSDVLPPTEGFPRFFSSAVDSQGIAYFADVNNHARETSRILQRTPGGQVRFLAGGAWGHADGKGAAARFGSVGGLAVGPDDSLYLTDGPALRRVAPGGSVTTVARGGLLQPTRTHRFFHGLSNPLMGLAVARSGDVFVANYGNRRVVKVRLNGKAETTARSEWPWSPTGVALGPEGIYILEYGIPLLPGKHGVRVRTVSPNGAIRRMAVVGG